MTRDEHLAWCKKRAHQYLAEGDVMQAVASMLSDLRKHPETASSGEGICAQLGLLTMMKPDDLDGARRYIDGFN